MDSPTTVPRLTAAHCRRLRLMWRSAGWPCQDLLEIELLAAGLLERLSDGQGRESLRVTDAGIAVIASSLASNRAARSAHEALVGRVALQMHRAGRLVWRGLSLRAPPLAVDGVAAGPWPVVMPDVFSIRHTTVEDYVEPIVHEIKVSRADLLGDLRRPAKREAYRALSSQCWYVLKAGIGTAEDIPEGFGVMLATPTTLEVARPAPRAPRRLALAAWMALARANAEGFSEADGEGQAQLVAADPGPD